MQDATHVYNSWSSFKTFLDQSNWGGTIVSLIVPTIPITLYTRYEHRKTRAHAERLHRAAHPHLRQGRRGVPPMEDERPGEDTGGEPGGV